MERPDWRDIDLRLMMPDDEFEKEFPEAGKVVENRWEFDAKWLLLTIAISERLSKQTGLPVDFQFQPISNGNGPWHGKKKRNPIGLRFAD